MNRPTRNTLWGCLLVLIIAFILALKARAGSPGLDALKSEYDRCVFGAIADMRPTKISVASATEKAFRTCNTEEQAMISTLALMPGSDMTEIVAAITAHKLQLKRAARDIVKN